MRLYHYMEADYLLGSISSNALKISTMNSLNDPYEMLPANVSREEMQEILKNTGILCLSKTVDSSAMWAHYANRHTGVALEFEFCDEQVAGLFEVEYKRDRVRIAPDDDMSVQAVRNIIIERLIKTKDTSWSYEQEYRWAFLLTDEGVLTNEKGLFFRHLPQELQRIILGVDCQLQVEDVSRELKQVGFDDIVVANATLSNSRFEVVVP